MKKEIGELERNYALENAELKDLLKLAGKLSQAARKVVMASALNVSGHIEHMYHVLQEYDSSVIKASNKKD